MKIWKEDLIGVLATADEIHKENGRDNIFVNNENSLQFLIKIISTNPEGFPNIKYVNCFTSTWEEDFSFIDDVHMTKEERKQKLEDMLEEHLIIFNVEEKFTNKHDKVYNAKNVRLVKKNKSYNNSMFFHPLPVFNSKISDVNNFERFLLNIKEKRFLGKIDKIMTDNDETPEFIVWEEQIGIPRKIIGTFSKHEYAYGGFKFTDYENLIAIDFDQDWLDDVVSNGESVMFLSLEVLKKIEKIIKESDKKIELNEDDEKETLKSDSSLKEKEFLDNWYRRVNDSGLSYSYKDLINFHTSMKSSKLVILSGTSGVGKTKIIDSYQKALGLKDQFKFISVSPSWTEDSDLIGYADTLNMIYRSSDSGLIEILIEAQKEENSEKMYMVCFDEMNLAKVEHYFSQFLSKLELESSERYIQLYVSDLENRLYNTAKYPHKIQIKDNVYFVGTVNIDESTHHFSNKVLDRANVLELEVINFKELDKNKIKKIQTYEPIKYYEYYESFVNRDEGVELNERIKELLWELYKMLVKSNKNIGFGPRVVKQIDSYIKNLPETEVLSKQEAIDLQIQQRILTKLRGSEDEIGSIVGSYNVTTKDYENGEIMDIFQEYKDISEFNHSIKVVKNKARELGIHGYAF
ncbi:AAA family ATPase [Macrococcoides canis]|uniref:McrB family protein n=1 Tax=Macrococcoides canis TaxID=1855823 RepID=UPI001F3F0781|nr:AAA family ATPase [Macrococcus canis]UJS27849.1 AAA family ATPase [Macrococcus canis]